MRTSWDEIWRFETPRFLVIAEATDCPDDPADSFERSDDIEAVRSGNVAWFDARVRVVLKDGDIELGSDYLGACAYDDPADLFRDHARGTRRHRVYVTIYGNAGTAWFNHHGTRYILPDTAGIGSHVLCLAS